MQPPTAKRSLKQRHLLFGSREFVIQGEDTLLIRERFFFNYHETLLPLSVLQPNPTHATSFAVKWLLLCLFNSTMSGFLIYAAWQFALPVLYILAVVPGIAALVMLYRFTLYTAKLTIFRHRISNEHYVYLWRNRPRRQPFEAFLYELMRLIQKNAR